MKSKKFKKRIKKIVVKHLLEMSDITQQLLQETQRADQAESDLLHLREALKSLQSEFDNYRDHSAVVVDISPDDDEEMFGHASLTEPKTTITVPNEQLQLDIERDEHFPHLNGNSSS